jgi:hypothetical protein
LQQKKISTKNFFSLATFFIVRKLFSKAKISDSMKIIQRSVMHNFSLMNKKNIIRELVGE